MKEIINIEQLYVERLINRYPDDLSILEKVSLSINGLSNVLVLQHSSKAIGFLVLDFFSDQIDSSYANIYNIYINNKHMEYLGRNMLIKEASKISRAEGFKYLSYQVDIADSNYVEKQIYKDYLYFINKGFHLEAHNNKLYFVKNIAKKTSLSIA